MTALLILTAMSQGMPVLCFSAAHTGLETPFAPCCGGPPAAPEASSEGCGDCDDVPLVSAAVSGLSQEMDYLPVRDLLQTTASILAPLYAGPPALLPPISQPLPLRC